MSGKAPLTEPFESTSPDTPLGTRTMHPGDQLLQRDTAEEPAGGATAVSFPGFGSNMLAISSVLLKGRKEGPRAFLCSLLGSRDSTTTATEPSNSKALGKIKTLSAHQSSSCHARGRNAKAIPLADLEEAPEQHYSYLCGCVFCVRERELRWQLFLLKERQESVMHGQHMGANHPNQPHLRILASEAQEFPHAHGPNFLDAADVFHDHPSQYLYPAPRTNECRGSVGRGSRQGQPQTASLHRFTAALTYGFILLLHTIYPHAKALLKALIDFEKEQKLRERALNQTYIVIAWIWRVLIVGTVGWLFAGLDRDSGNEVKDAERARRDQEGAEMVKLWVRRCMAEVVGGVCEGVEGGVKVWCGVE